MKRDDPPMSYYEEPEPKLAPPVCPICGEETDTFIADKDRNIIGCENCIEYLDAWDFADEEG